MQEHQTIKPMKNTIVILFFGTLMAWGLLGQTGCYYDNEEDLYPFTDMCDTVNTTLASTVKPILAGQCFACHSASSASIAGAGINLEDYTPLKGWVDNGKFGCAINHSGGCSPMPKGGGRLPQCDIDKINAWIARGAQNN